MLRTFALVLLLAAIPAAAQPPSPAPGDGSSRQLLSVDDVVREVLAGHPAIAASSLAVDSQMHHAKSAGALPDPALSVAYMGDAAPFRTMANDPSSYRGLSAMQTLPLGGKRELHRAMARAEVHAGQADLLTVTRRLKSEAEAAFYNYFYYSRALEVTGHDKARLEQLVETTEARYRVGKASQADVLRAQLEVSTLLQRAATLAQQQETAAAHINLLMGRTIDAPLPPPADVVRTPLPQMAVLAPAAETNDPALHKELAMVERGTLKVSAAHKEYIPDLSVGYMFQQRTGLPEMYGAQFSLNIPVFYRSRQREDETAAKLELSAAEKSRDARKLELAYELKQMHAMAANAAQMLNLYDRAILPQAELALQSSESSYAVDSVDFFTVVTNLTAIHGYQVDYYRQVADYATALARIEALTGDLSQLGSESKITSEAKQ